jgi:polar amino acid transport system substrate-binding protein
MKTGRRYGIVATLLGIGLVAAGCSSGAKGATSATASGGAGDPTKDLLAEIQARGTIVLSTDPLYPPQSFAVKGATRLADTKCAPNQMTAPEISGYDAETGVAVAKALGVEPCFVAPTWTEITAGNWGGRWDIAYGSGAINSDRMKRLWMTQPYREEAQKFFVQQDSPYQTPSDLDGKRIGVCASCTVEYYLKGELEIPGVNLQPKVADPKIVSYQAEPAGLKALDAGKIDAFLTAEAEGEGAIKDGLALRPLKEEAFTMYLSGFVDKSNDLAVGPFIDRVNVIVKGLLADGTLQQLSMKYFGKDYASGASTYDLGILHQAIP